MNDHNSYNDTPCGTTNANVARDTQVNDYVRLLLRCKIFSRDSRVNLDSILSEIDRVVPLEPLTEGLINVASEKSLQRELPTKNPSESRPQDHESIELRYHQHYGSLRKSSDVVGCKAQWLYTRGNYRECLNLIRTHPSSQLCHPHHILTSSLPVLGLGTSSQSILLLSIACMYALGQKNDLFLLAHKLVEEKSDSPIGWYSVGCYYMSIRSYNNARRYFSKSMSLGESSCLPAHDV